MLYCELLPCKYRNPWSHSLFALTAIRKDIPQWLHAAIVSIFDAGYIRRVKPVSWVLCFVNVMILVSSSCCLLCSVATFSTLMSIGVKPVRMQNASWDIVRYALAIIKLISLCTLTYLVLLHFFIMDSTHTGAAYSSCGSIEPLYIVFSASCFSPQFNLADLDNAFINLVHLSVMYFMCSLNLNLLSINIPKYLILSTCSRWLFPFLSLSVIVMHGTYQTVPDLWSSPLPLCTVHNRQYLTSDPARYRYARYIPNSTWPLMQPATVMHGTYQTVPDLWSSPLPLCTVNTRHYLTSDVARYRYARYIPDSIWPLIQPVTVMHGTYQTLPDFWSSPLPLCTVHTREHTTSATASYRYAR